jgi:hypothetical protein
MKDASFYLPQLQWFCQGARQGPGYAGNVTETTGSIPKASMDQFFIIPHHVKDRARQPVSFSHYTAFIVAGVTTMSVQIPTFQGLYLPYEGTQSISYFPNAVS